MWFTSKDMHSELNKIQKRMQLLKEQNKILLKNSKIGESKEIISLDKINDDVETSGLRLYSYKDEVAAVEKCYRKSKKLIEYHCRQKKRKKLIKNMYTNRMPVYNLQKKNIKSIDKNWNQDMAETIILSDSDIDSSCQETSSRILTSIVDKRTFTKLDPCQNIKKSDYPKKCEDSDVVHLQTVNSSKTVKCKKLKKSLDYEIQLKNNEINLTNKGTFEDTSVKNCKDLYLEHFDSKKRKKKLFNTRSNSALTETNDFNTKSDTEKNDEDVIYLETLSQGHKSLNNNEHNSHMHSCNVSGNPSVGKRNKELEVSSSKRNETINKVPEKSHYEVKFSKQYHSKQINIEQDCSETVVPVWDFTEEPVNFDVPYLHIEENLNKLSDKKRELLRSKGIAVKIGKWSEEEIAFLHRNYKNFTSEFGINDASLLLGIGRTVIRKGEFNKVMKFLKAKHFLLRLGKDINSRPLVNIYLKARSEFFPIVKGKKCTAEDIPFLMELQNKYGNNWYLIAQKFNLPPLKCKLLFLQHSKSVNKGRWTAEEKKYLINAIRKITKVKDIFHKTFKRIPWEKVAELVPTRTNIQCKMEWSIISNKEHNDTCLGS